MTPQGETAYYVCAGNPRLPFGIATCTLSAAARLRSVQKKGRLYEPRCLPGARISTSRQERVTVQACCPSTTAPSRIFNSQNPGPGLMMQINDAGNESHLLQESQGKRQGIPLWHCLLQPCSANLAPPFENVQKRNSTRSGLKPLNQSFENMDRQRLLE